MRLSRHAIPGLLAELRREGPYHVHGLGEVGRLAVESPIAPNEEEARFYRARYGVELVEARSTGYRILGDRGDVAEKLGIGRRLTAREAALVLRVIVYFVRRWREDRRGLIEENRKLRKEG